MKKKTLCLLSLLLCACLLCGCGGASGYLMGLFSHQREDDAGKQHPLQVEPLLMVGLVHMLGPLKPKQGQIGEQDPVEKAGVV